MSKHKCPECNKCFQNRSRKSLCMRRHNNKNLVFQCPCCPRVYRDPSSLRRHKRLYEHKKNIEQEPEIPTPETVVIPMNLSCEIPQSRKIITTQEEVIIKTTLPSIDTFAFNHSAIDCRINNSKDNQACPMFPERALDLTSTFRPKVFINPCSALSFGPSQMATGDSDSFQCQYPINLTIHHHSNGYYAYDSPVPIDLSYQTFWNSNHSSQPINFTNLLNSTSCPLDLTLDQSYSHEYDSNSTEIGWIC